MKFDPKAELNRIVSDYGGCTKCKFHAKRKWLFAWAIPSVKIGIELDSGMIGKTNWEKFNAATIAGWDFIVVRSCHVRSGEAKRLLEELLRAKGGGQI